MLELLCMPCLGMRWWRHNAAAGCPPLLARHPLLHPPPLAAAEIADFLMAEGLVPVDLAAQLAAQLTPSPAAAAVVAVEVSRKLGQEKCLPALCRQLFCRQAAC